MSTSGNGECAGLDGVERAAWPIGADANVLAALKGTEHLHRGWNTATGTGSANATESEALEEAHFPSSHSAGTDKAVNALRFE